MNGASSSAASGPIRPRRRPGENRAGLISAGIIEFGLHGYSASQTSSIAQRAGVSQPNVYANFASKQQLFFACIREVISSALPAASTPTESYGNMQAGAEDIPDGDSTHSDDIDATFSVEHCLLVYQAVAALGDVRVSAMITPMLGELVVELGERRFQQVIYRGTRALIAHARAAEQGE